MCAASMVVGEARLAVGTAALTRADPRDADHAPYHVHGVWCWARLIREKAEGMAENFWKACISLHTLVNIIQSLYDGNTFVCITSAYLSFI